MLNGSTLKVCFLMIVSTLCAIVLFLVYGVVFCKFPLEESKAMLGMLGVSALFGGITQAFVHANIADVSNKQVNEAAKPNITQISPIVGAEEKKP